MTIDNIVYYLLNISLCFTQILFICLNLTPKNNKYLTFFVFFIPYTAVAVSQRILYFIPPIFLVIVAYAIYALCSLLLFSNPVREKIFVSIFALVTQHISTIPYVIVSITIMDDRYSPYYPYMAFIPIYIVIMSAFTYIRRKKIKFISMSKYHWTVFIIIPLSQIFLITSTALLFIMDILPPGEVIFPFAESDENVILLFIIISMLFCLIADTILIVIMNRLSQSNKLLEELRFREYQNELSLEYYRSIEENAFETRKIRHDLANIVEVVYRLIENGDEPGGETSAQILAQLRDSISHINLEKYTDNSLINAIISNKASLCRKKNIAFSFDIRVPQKINIEEIDLCKAYVNIIDNAINAADKLSGDDRRIEIASYIDDGYLYIKSKNSVLPEIEKESPVKDGHGLGQKILCDTADKYNGSFMAENNGATYNTLFVMKA